MTTPFDDKTDPRHILVLTSQATLMAARQANEKAQQVARDAKECLDAAQAAHDAVCKLVQAGVVSHTMEKP